MKLLIFAAALFLCSLHVASGEQGMNSVFVATSKCKDATYRTGSEAELVIKPYIDGNEMPEQIVNKNQGKMLYSGDNINFDIKDVKEGAELTGFDFWLKTTESDDAKNAWHPQKISVKLIGLTTPDYNKNTLSYESPTKPGGDCMYSNGWVQAGTVYQVRYNKLRPLWNKNEKANVQRHLEFKLAYNPDD